MVNIIRTDELTNREAGNPTENFTFAQKQPEKTENMGNRKLSHLAETLIPSEIVKLGGIIKEKIGEGHKIYNYTIGDFNPSIFPIPVELNEEIVRAYQQHHTNYPAANGMPELHALTPALANLQDAGYHVALVTDGRMSGASGKVPAAIHVCPEALSGGAIGLWRDDGAHVRDLSGHTGHVNRLAFTPDGRALRLPGITVIEYEIARGSVAAYYPEANVLAPLDDIDEESGTPSYKSIPVRLVKAAPAAATPVWGD